MSTDVQSRQIGSSMPASETGPRAVISTFPVNPKTLTWQRLEELRLESLGLSNKYSRHFNVLRRSDDSFHSDGTTYQLSGVANPRVDKRSALQKTQRQKPDGTPISRKANSVAPFATVGKATCGFFFSRETDNKKKKFGIPPSDLVKWRNI